ncbi:MAG: hypothetical protein RLZ12_905 [Bacillota bacterium]|jgi:2-C-methyl-D-erythritol 4-phosphate cytidylyltransferase
MTLDIIVPAAGVGTRFSRCEPKQFIDLVGKPLLVHTLCIFEQIEHIKEIIVVIKQEYRSLIYDYIKKYNLRNNIKVVIGGKSRQESVYKGLSASSADRILVHDAVRPLVSVKAIRRVIKALEKRRAVTMGLPVRETVKVVDAEYLRVVKTLDRKQMWLAQTPQGFWREELLKAHFIAQKQGFFATDDVALIEAMGVDVDLIEGEARNIKITSPEDLSVVRAWLEMQTVTSGSC